MITHGLVTLLDAKGHLAIAEYVRDSLLRSAERGAALDPAAVAFVKIADEIAADTYAYVTPLRNSASAQEESSPEVDRLPPEITASVAAKILDRTPHWARELARRNGWICQEVPIITMSRDAVLAYVMRRDEETKISAEPLPRTRQADDRRSDRRGGQRARRPTSPAA
jgi:hypothetical protein